MAQDIRRDVATDETSVRFSWSAVRETPRYTYLIAAIAAIGGMLFGYDIGVISGAENLLKSAFRLSSGTEELAVAAVLIGAVIGGIFGGPLADRISRRYTLLMMAVLYGIGAILTSHLLGPGVVPRVPHPHRDRRRRLLHGGADLHRGTRPG